MRRYYTITLKVEMKKFLVKKYIFYGFGTVYRQTVYRQTVYRQTVLSKLLFLSLFTYLNTYPVGAIQT
jgi:hypothetical protein